MRKGNSVTFMNCHRCFFLFKVGNESYLLFDKLGREMETNEVESVAGYNLEMK